MISTPVKTSISRIDGKKIDKLDDALKIRDNPKMKIQKKNELLYKETFDTVWEKYIKTCENIRHLAYNTMQKKKIRYNKYIKGNFEFKKLSKISKEDISKFLGELKTTNKEKNEILKIIKAFFNWCIEEEYILVSPTIKIKPYKVEKVQMKYWEPKEIKDFLNILDQDINSSNLAMQKKALLIKILVLIEISIGDRIGETRALTFKDFSNNILTIRHSINYDRSSEDFLSSTKTYQSQRDIIITDKLINAINEYKDFLIKHTEYEIKENNLIFFNYATNKPYSDTTLRKNFHFYCQKANVTKIRMYDLRHTYVSLLMSEGKELYQISSRLGHSSYSTTVNKYGHLSNNSRKEIAKITDKFIS